VFAPSFARRTHGTNTANHRLRAPARRTRRRPTKEERAMRHRMISILAFSLVMALATGVALLAQDTATSTGKVANVDASAGTITLTTAGGSPDTFSTDSQSMYMSNGRTITLQSVKIGDQVTVTYRNDSGRKTATHVDVVSGAGSTTTRNTTYGSDTGTTTNS